MSARTRFIIFITAIVSLVLFVVVLVATGIHMANVRQWNQNEQIEQLKEALETQQRDYIECRRNFSFSFHASRPTTPAMKV